MTFYEAMRRAFLEGDRNANLDNWPNYPSAEVRFAEWFKEQFGKTDGQQHLRIESLEIRIIPSYGVINDEL